MSDKIKLLAVAGPTASGKTALSVALAELLGGEVVSCDSMQIYRGMDIGSAKPTAEETHGIPHHMIDIADPFADVFSCADYVSMASQCVKDIASRGRLPIVCGGTGLYLDNLLYSNEFSSAGADETIRAQLMELPCDELHRRLSEVDPESAAAIHMNNKKRVARALEVYLVTGKTKTEWDRQSRVRESMYDSLTIALDCRDRAVLYDRIDRRVDMMIEAGLVEEAAKFRNASGTAAQAIGYKELWGYIDGVESLESCVEKLKQATRNYAKRQLTWFRRNPDIHWIYIDECCDEASNAPNFKYIVNIAFKLLKETEFCDIIN